MILYYHKDPRGNFGDDLNPWLLPKLFPGEIATEFHHEASPIGALDGGQTLLVGIGTLINSGVPTANRKLVFGSGVGYGGLPEVDASWSFLFVRGPLTAAKLKLPPAMAISDPAIIACDHFVRQPAVASRGISFMPHCASARSGDWDAICADAGLNFIDPQWPVDKVLAEIAASSMLITEALHGAIVADSMRIPWIPVVTSNQILEFKWLDWCASIGVNYQPRRIIPLWKPAGSPIKRLRYAIKVALATRQLRQVKKYGAAVLSADPVIRHLKQRIGERIETHCLERVSA